MAWSIRLDRRAQKDIAALSTIDWRRIETFLLKRLVSRDDPRELGEPLAGKFKGLWRYRVGEFRIVANIEDDIVFVTVIRIGHRREIYR